MMTEVQQSTHTPGPWTRAEDFYATDARLTYGRVVADGVTIANVPLWAQDLTRREGNVNLIATAPELLEVVRRLRFLLAEHDLDELHPLAIVNAITDMDAAIAKATGVWPTLPGNATGVQS